MVDSSLRLKQLYVLVEKINLAMLGNDWQSRKLLKELKQKALQEIQNIQANTVSKTMVK